MTAKLQDDLNKLKDELNKLTIPEGSGKKNGCYLAFDSETTGLPKEMPKGDKRPYLGEYPYLVEVGFVPFDAINGFVYESLAFRILIKCPDLATLKKEKRVSEWNLSRPSSVALIENSAKNGVSLKEAEEAMVAYFNIIEPIVGKKPILAGKSIASLDKPMLWNYFSPIFIDNNCCHQDYDLTGLLQGLQDAGVVDSLSMEKLAKQFLNINKIGHDSISDSIVVAKLIIFLTKHLKEKLYA